MANRSNNIWAKAAAGSPGTNIARAQQSRWTGIPNEAIMRLVEDKIGGMLEGISDATERNAAALEHVHRARHTHATYERHYKRVVPARVTTAAQQHPQHGELTADEVLFL